MKIHTLLAVLTIFFCTNLLGQNPYSMNQEEIELNRKEHCVKNVVHYVQKADKNGKLLEKKFRAKSKYNENGKLLDGELENNGRHIRNTYEYDEYNNTSKSEIYINGKLTSKSIFEYDDNSELYRTNSNFQNGRLINTIKEKVKLKNSMANKSELKKTEIKFDSLAYTYYTKRSPKSGVEMFKNKYKLDKKGRIIEWVEEDNASFEKSYKTYVYTENGYIEEEIFYNYDDSIDKKYINVYNKMNLLIESKWYSGNGKLKQISNYEYITCKKKA